MGAHERREMRRAMRESTRGGKDVLARHVTPTVCPAGGDHVAPDQHIFAPPIGTKAGAVAALQLGLAEILVH
jgi:hypothetical protein